MNGKLSYKIVAFYLKSPYMYLSLQQNIKNVIRSMDPNFGEGSCSFMSVLLTRECRLERIWHSMWHIVHGNDGKALLNQIQLSRLMLYIMQQMITFVYVYEIAIIIHNVNYADDLGTTSIYHFGNKDMSNWHNINAWRLSLALHNLNRQCRTS